MENYMMNSTDNFLFNGMDNYRPDSMDSYMEYSNRIEDMYPDSYKMLYPYVQDTVDSISDERMYNVSHDDVGMLADEALSRGNFLSPDPSGPAGHSGGFMRDFAKALIVRELFDRHRRRRAPFVPFIFYPFDPMNRRNW